jgi:hypothetical protein
LADFSLRVLMRHKAGPIFTHGRPIVTAESAPSAREDSFHPRYVRPSYKHDSFHIPDKDDQLDKIICSMPFNALAVVTRAVAGR